jgi:methanogenic corrinoid protein MtbC1
MRNAGFTHYHPVSLNREYLTGKMLERYKEKHTKIWSDFGLEQRAFVREAYLATIQGLEESLATGKPAFLIDHAGWEQSRFAARNFPPGFAVSFFEIFKTILSRELPEDYRKNAGAFAGKAVSALKSTTAGSGAYPDAGTTLSPKARSFLKFLLAGDPARGRGVIEKAYAGGTPIRGIYTGIFLPVLHETGRLWQQDEVTIAQEHFVTSAIRHIMEQMHDRRAATGGKARREKTVVAACVGEELHEIGIRMVADFFEMDGWDVYYIGANAPAKSIIAAVTDQKADVVALSITMPSRLAGLRYLIRSLRADEATEYVKVIVGGFPFSIMPDLGKQIGADAVAKDAEDAVAIANRITKGRQKQA